MGAPILSQALRRGFILPLSERLDGAEAETRAALATAYILGFAVLRAALQAPSLGCDDSGLIVARLGDALQTCLAPDGGRLHPRPSRV